MTTTKTFTYSHTIGFLAATGRGFTNPVDLAINSEGILYVLNRAGPETPVRLPSKRVSICTLDEEYLGDFGTGGIGDGEFWWPSSIAIDSQDRVYVADEGLQRVTMFSKDGEYLGKWGEKGPGDGQLEYPSSLAFDADDNLYLTDSGNHRVQKFTSDGKSIAAWGQWGSGSGQFEGPWGLALGITGDVYVSDWGNDRIQRYDTTGRLIEEFGGLSGGNAIHRPAGLAVDGDGNIYVADWGNERVKVLAPDGSLLASLRGQSVDSKWAADYFEANPEEGRLRYAADLRPEIDPPARRDREISAGVESFFWGPTAVKLDGQGRLYVADSLRHRLQIYETGG
jgi:DNA-binding beta-propeller fold protein YncE